MFALPEETDVLRRAYDCVFIAYFMVNLQFFGLGTFRITPPDMDVNIHNKTLVIFNCFKCQLRFLVNYK